MGKKSKKKSLKSKDNNTSNKRDIYFVKNISMQSNEDPEYQEIGVVNFSVPGALSGFRELISDEVTYYGFAGFKEQIYYLSKIKTLEKLKLVLKENQKICNLKIQLKIAIQGNNPEEKKCDYINPLESYQAFLICKAMNILPRGSLFFVHVFGTLFEKIPTITDKNE